MKRISNRFIGISIILLLAMLLAACGGSGSTNNPNGTATPGTSGTANATPPITPSPGVKLGVQPCPAAVKDPASWNSILHPPQGEKVYTVTCANLKGNPSLQALVTEICDCSGGFMNVYVYTSLTNSPQQIFKREGLEKGDAKISNYNTVLTGEVDEKSSVNKNATANAQLQTDLFREYKWSDSTGSLVQIVFSGMFPDLTRFQAENDQAQVNQGHEPWKLSATQVAVAFVVNVVHWNSNSTATLQSGGGSKDADAVVVVKENEQNSSDPNPGPITINMSRLEGNTNGGIWIVTAASYANEHISSPQAGQSLTNPVTVQGTGEATNGTAGQIDILDHTYAVIGHIVDTHDFVQGQNPQKINIQVPYSSTIGGKDMEEGIVMLYPVTGQIVRPGSAGPAIFHPTLVKVLLG